MSDTEMEKGVREFLRSSAPPFLLTVLVGAFAWWITHTVDRLASQPIVKYAIAEAPSQCESVGACTSVVLEIENLSRTKFSNVTFELQVRKQPGQFVGKVTSVAVPPASITNVTEPVNNSITIRFDEFHPGFEGHVSAQYAADDGIVLLLSSSDQAMRLVRPSITTFFLENEFWVLLGALTALLAISASVLVPNKSTGRALGVVFAAGFLVLLAL